jgi:hypothetical protein
VSKTLKYQAVLILFLSFALAQNQGLPLSKRFIPFQDKSSLEYYRYPLESDLAAYGLSSQTGYIGCSKDEEAVGTTLKGFPKNLSLLVSDMAGLRIDVFTINCGNEVHSMGAGFFSYRDNLIGFERANKQIAYLILYRESRAKQGNSIGSVSDLQRLDYGVYSFIRTNIGTWGYNQQYFLFTVNSDGITLLIDDLPLADFPANALEAHSPQLQVSVYWPYSFEVIPLNNNLTIEQREWVGIFNF